MRDRAQVVYAIVFLDLMMMFALVPLLPEYQSTFGLSKTQAGLVVSAYSFAVLVLSAPVGWLADGIGPKRLTLIGVALMAVSTPAYAFGHGFWPLLAARGLQGAASAVSWTAGLAWLMAVNPPDRRGRVLGTATGFGGAGVLLGPVFAGVIASFFGIRVPFVVLGVIAGLLAVWVAVTPSPPLAVFDRISLPAVIRRSFAETSIVAAVVVIFLAAVVGGTTETLVPIFLGHHGYGTGLITAILTASGILTVTTNRVVGGLSDRTSKRRIALVSCTGTAFGLIALALVPVPVAAAIVFVVMTPAISGLYGVGYPLSAEGADSAGLGHSGVFGLINLIWGGGFVVGPAMGAALASATSDQVTYAVLVATTVVAGLYLRRLALD